MEPEPKLTFETIVARARALAGQSVEQPDRTMPESLRNLDFTRYRSIRFRPKQALWRGESLFEIQLFHRGFLYEEPVAINVVEDGVSRRVTFSTDLFNYGESGTPQDAADDIGFAGFRVHFPLNASDYADEAASFLGASYFRLLGRAQIYGLSGRGLAVDTALPKGEEFPRFREFWLLKPAPDATSITILALLDSQSVTGAYRFEIQPGAPTEMEVQAELFTRGRITRLGVAPMTSMFLFGENQPRSFDDFRPEVHDSDGLQISTAAGEWIWRPLSNPGQLRVTSFVGDMRGFGLMQRDRDYENYLDIHLHYERRAHLWMEPLEGAWNGGSVVLVEIPAPEEVHDNIVSFWAPKDPLEAGTSRSYRYRLYTSMPDTALDRLGKVRRTRLGSVRMHGGNRNALAGARRIVVDFSGGPLDTLANGQPVQAEISSSAGEVSDVYVQKAPEAGTWRASFRLIPAGESPADMRLYLSLRGRRLTETWSYIRDTNARE
ncbi:MAG: glucan biosynthesis protein [Acetobacterales bacterium]